MIKKLFLAIIFATGFQSSSNAQYCVTTLHSIDCTASGNGAIDAVSITNSTLSNTSSGCNGVGDAYFYFTGASNYSCFLTKGLNYTLNVTGSGTSQIISVWIDYDQSQTFDASEWTEVTAASTIGVSTSVNITIPTGATTGATRMRIRSRNAGFANGSADACTVFGSGETEDYAVTISASGSAGCIAGAQYPAAAITGPTLNGQTVDITTLADCNYSGEYALVILGVGSYTLTSSTTTDYFTVTNGLNSVLFTGAQPLTFSIVSSATYRVHVFQDNLCTVNSVCRAVAITKNTTTATLPTVTTTAVSAITYNSATSGGNVTVAGSSSVFARGVCYATTANPTTSNFTVSTGTGLGVFTSSMSSGLSPSTTYHVRAYATNNTGTAYGADLTFTTAIAPGCIATSQYPSSTVTGPTTNGQTVAITQASGTCNYSGEYSVVTLGIGSYTITSSISTDFFTVTDQLNAPLFSGVQPLAFSVATAGTFRIHVFSGNGCIADNICRGVSITKNSSTVLATVTTTAATAITAGGATTGGNVTSAGSASVTARGVCYATTANPTTASSFVAAAAGGTGAFSVNLTGLGSGTLYHIRAYATSTAGTSYGSDLTFTTTAQALASVSTASITAVTTSTATSGGNVTSIGGSAVTSRGICYATTTNPTLANTVISGGSGAGTYVSNLSGLSPNTTYYVRAYATNTTGTAYGNQISFVTTNPTAPSVTTSAASSVSFFTATAGGNVTSTGTATLTDKGICYSTSPSPTIAGAHVSSIGSGGSTGTFTADLIGLAGSTTYHIRAYATNSVGTSYGSDLTFTTLNPCINSTELYLTNLAFMDLATANATSTYYGTYVTPNAQGLPGLPASLNYNPVNPYNLINPGFPVRMKVKSYNNKTNGTSVVSGLCKLRTTDPNITIIDSTAGLNNVGWHNEAWSTDEFEFQISWGVFTSYTAYVEVVVVEGPNQYYTRCIPIPIRAFTVANLDVDDDNNPDSYGNNNDIAEPSEIVEFLPYINNSSSFSASYVAGFIQNFDYLSNVSVWDNHPGASGNVYAQGWWNFSFAQPQPIPAGTTNTLPEYDFVYDYTYASTYQFNLHLMMAGGFNLLNSPNNITLMRTSIPLAFNNGYPSIPPTGLKEVTASDAINVYPNPFNSEIVIKVKANLAHTAYTISNPLGMIVATGNLEGEKTLLNLEKLANGLYTINIVGQQSLKISKK